MLTRVGAEWAVVAAAAITGVLTLLGTSVIPYFTERARAKRNRELMQADARAAAFTELRRIYAASLTMLESEDDPGWVNVTASAARCIPYVARESEARKLLLSLADRKFVDLGTLIDALPDET